MRTPNAPNRSLLPRRHRGTTGCKAVDLAMNWERLAVKMRGFPLVNPQWDPENNIKSPILSGNSSSNPYLVRSMWIYWGVTKKTW